jgi:hypothetical protein
VVAFTIGAPDCSAQRRHIVPRTIDLVGLLFGRGEQRAAAREKSPEGGRRTAEALAGLPETYVVFNDYRPSAQRFSAKWGVDHLVIGPSGVFVIESVCPEQRRVDPAAASRATATRIKRVRELAAEFRASLADWSCGSFADVWVKPILVYAQEQAYVEKLQEGPVKVIPLRWLTTEVTERTFEPLTPDQVYRLAHCLFEQLPQSVQKGAQPQLDRLGVIARAWLAQQVSPQLQLPISLD